MNPFSMGFAPMLAERLFEPSSGSPPAPSTHSVTVPSPSKPDVNFVKVVINLNWK
ncbi:MAG: hypothetical protein VYD90_12190 [Pseudomonadota bacterium]|nr:hypothetical protein [Pseudomonadota bacterium]